MTVVFLNLVFLALAAVSVFFLYNQIKVYREQKELISRESKALKLLRNKNLEALRSRFRIQPVNIKVY